MAISWASLTCSERAWQRYGRQGRQGWKHYFLGASCAEPSGARLRAADEAVTCLFIVRASKESKSKLNYIDEACS